MRFFSILFFFAFTVICVFPVQGNDRENIGGENPARIRIRELSAEITRHNYLYYELGKPEITKEEYDHLLEELSRLEKAFPQFVLPDSPTLRVGAVPANRFPQVRHPLPMLSLEKCHSPEDVSAWMEKIQKTAGKNLLFAAEEKMDGTAIELIYEKGNLRQALTRGDGESGYDITPNIRTVRRLPQQIGEKGNLVVRGEVFIRLTDFRRIREKGNREYDSPRNLAAGTLRKKDPRECAKIPLDIFIFEAVRGVPAHLADHWAVLKWLRGLGFPVNPRNRLMENAGEAEIFIRESEARRNSGDKSRIWPTDGLVFKVNDLHIRNVLGYASKYPRWAIAYKYEPIEALSVVESIAVRIGRLGRATPVARFRPVRILGADIGQATVHNQAYIRKLGLSLGDTVRISRRGDVIPAIEEVLRKKEPGTYWRMPAHCPVCKAELRKEGGHRICPNRDCPEQVRAGLLYFARCMGIRNMGPETLRVLMEQNIVKHPEDFYRLRPDDLKEIRGFSEKKIRACLSAIEKSRKKPFATVMRAMGIPGLGKRNIRLLTAAGFDTAEKIMRAEAGTPAGVKGIGKSTVRKILSGFRPRVKESIRELRKEGLNL